MLIDKLNKIEGENITERLNSIFDSALNPADRAKICIKKAYRLGKRPIGNIPRKVFVELGSIEEKEILLANSRGIAQVGNNGNIFYLNEDIPDDLKKRRNYIFKYIKYMERRGRVVERVGDDILVNGT